MAVSYTVDGTTLDYDSISIFTLVEEDGELKITDLKDFCNPEKCERSTVGPPRLWSGGRLLHRYTTYMRDCRWDIGASHRCHQYLVLTHMEPSSFSTHIDRGQSRSITFHIFMLVNVLYS